MTRPALLALAALLASAPLPAADAEPGLRMLIESTGVYRVARDGRLEEVWPEACAASADLALSSRGRPVPIWVEDGGDGRFDPGDWIEFVGEALPHDDPALADMTRFNVYVLRCDRGAAARMRPAPPPGPAPDPAPARLTRSLHLEENRMMLRFSDPDPTAERWYWARLTPVQRTPFELELELEGLDVGAVAPIALSVRLRGWSEPVDVPAAEIPDHRVEALLDGVPIGAAEWNRQDVVLLEATARPDSLSGARPTLRLGVPRRPSTSEGDPISDVVAVDWVELAYPHSGRVGSSQLRLEPEMDPDRPARLRLAGTGSVLAFGCDGWRAEAGPTGPPGDDGAVPLAVPLPHATAACGRVDVVPATGFLRPAALEREVRASLAVGRRADMIVVAHPRLLDAVAPLAEIHRRRGLEVELVDLRAVYDEFGDGLAHPAAIRSFLEHAWRSWTPPAPRFVLLVGDSSWDVHNDWIDESAYAAWTWQPRHGTRMPTTQGTAYPEGELRNSRNLIPTWSLATSEGHAASDTPFVTFGDDDRPVMAIGRFPVVEPAEVAAIVAKVEAAVAAGDPGPWRRSLLWISDGESYMDAASDRLAARYDARGFRSVRFKPDSAAAAGGDHRRRLLEALGAGHLVVHFIGHGGRFIWRTAPADYADQRDLFRLEDVDALPAGGPLPVVVSMTCYSAPFDHPRSDSIGEKLLRAPGRGAAAVIAASWRVAPDPEASREIVDRLTLPGTVGEALLAAKRATGSRQLVELFNLLGDPAMPLSPPSGTATVALGRGATPVVEVAVPDPSARGEVEVDWRGADGALLHTDRARLANGRARVPFGGTLAAAAAVSSAAVYAWDPASGLAALGAVEIPAR